jgi:hypothetical protein
MDRTGQQFGRLTVVGLLGRAPMRWACRCDCGNYKAVRASNLSGGSTNSCGCLVRDTNIARGHAFCTTHGHCKRTVGRSRTYNAWAAMKNRCKAGPDRPGAYKYYGAFGVTVCERWARFENFLADMGECPPGMTLDRYPDKNGHYEPSNCRWATPSQQSNNTRLRENAIVVTFQGQTLPLIEWARKMGTPYDALRWRFCEGWSPEKMLLTPFRRRRRKR